MTVSRFIWFSLQVPLWAALAGFIALLAIPKFTDFEVFLVRGGSMEPAISVGSAAIVNRADKDLRVGDVATFHDPLAHVVTHRVASIDGDLITTKGDANNSADTTPRTPADIIGTEIAAIPYLGYVLYALQKPAIFLILLGSTGGIVILGEIRAIARELQKMRKNSRDREASVNDA